MKKEDLLKKIRLKKKHIKENDSIYRSIFTMILFPAVIILVIFSIIFTISHMKDRKSLLKESYSYRLNLIARNNEDAINSIIQTVHMFDKNPDFINIAIGNTSPSESDILFMQTNFEQLVANNPILESAAFIDRQNKIVITNSDTYSLSSFFYEKYSYRDYDEDFWTYYQAPMSTVRALSPTYVDKKDDNVEGTLGIIPVVFTSIGDTKISNLIILNISISDILQSETQQFTKNSSFFLINLQTLQKFDQNNSPDSVIDRQFYQNITKDQYSVFDRKNENGKTELIISYSPKNSILGYCYAVSVPYGDINRSGYLYLCLVGGALIVLIAVSIAISHMGARRIYTPITEIADMFKRPDSYNNNILDFIKSSIAENLDNNSILAQEIALTLPAYKERLLIDFLNSNEYYRTDSQEYVKTTLDFKYSFFCSVIIKLSPTENFYKTYSNTEYNRIQNGIYTIIEYYFSQKFNTHIIPNDTDVLYVLLNMPEGESRENILSVAEELSELLRQDSNLLKLSIGIGDIAEGLDGLRLSHQQAMREISSVSDLRHIVLNLNNKTQVKKEGYKFTINEEENLYNMLLTGKKDQALSFIAQVYKDNSDLSDSSLMQLDMQIINTIFKIMRLKGIPYDENKRGDIAIISDMLSMPRHKVLDTINELVAKISSFIMDNNASHFTDTAVNYIENHYNEDICLESLSSITGVPIKQVSRIFKEQLGVNFVDYLAQIRINKAKEYLKKSNKTITEIYLLTGFNNRNTFLRTFKKITGLTPSEYKKTPEE